MGSGEAIAPEGVSLNVDGARVLFKLFNIEFMFNLNVTPKETADLSVDQTDTQGKSHDQLFHSSSQFEMDHIRIHQLV